MFLEVSLYNPPFQLAAHDKDNMLCAMSPLRRTVRQADLIEYYFV